jgi:hypothetical protein
MCGGVPPRMRMAARRAGAVFTASRSAVFLDRWTTAPLVVVGLIGVLGDLRPYTDSVSFHRLICSTRPFAADVRSAVSMLTAIN